MPADWKLNRKRFCCSLEHCSVKCVVFELPEVKKGNLSATAWRILLALGEKLLGNISLLQHPLSASPQTVMLHISRNNYPTSLICRWFTFFVCYAAVQSKLVFCACGLNGVLCDQSSSLKVPAGSRLTLELSDCFYLQSAPPYCFKWFQLCLQHN